MSMIELVAGGSPLLDLLGRMQRLQLCHCFAGSDTISTGDNPQQSFYGPEGEHVVWGLEQERRKVKLTVAVGLTNEQLHMLPKLARKWRVWMLVLMWHHASRRPDTEIWVQLAKLAV